MYIWELHKFDRCSNPFAMCEHQTFFRYLVIISHHQQRYRNHYYHHHQNHHHKHQLDKTIRVARVKTVSQSFSNYNLKVTVRAEFDSPTTQDIRHWRLFLASQLRRSKDARRCFSGSENDWKRIFSESISSGQSVLIKI